MSLGKKFILILDFSSPNGKYIASNLCHWIKNFEKIDNSNRDFIFNIVPYADENHNSCFVMDALVKFSETQALEIADIWIKMLDCVVNRLCYIMQTSNGGIKNVGSIQEARYIGCGLGALGAASSWPQRNLGRQRARQSTIYQRSLLDFANGRTLARSAAILW